MKSNLANHATRIYFMARSEILTRYKINDLTVNKVQISFAQ